ncbi:MAG: hypothetical protein CMF49_04820 [Legionellales bacterium]|nr:hypothetical protein [Legionellales bacterium]|tara:strand:- start:83 stop:481 length:399 start_codon:yes stop_codon:yes gene_type:complete
MAEYDIKNRRKNPKDDNEDDDGGEGARELQWQSRLYETYEAIHEAHQGEKAPTEGFQKTQESNPSDDPLLNRDLHPLAQEAYFSGIDNTADNSVPSENTDPNIRAELKKQLEYKLQLSNQPKMSNTPTPKPY